MSRAPRPAPGTAGRVPATGGSVRCGDRRSRCRPPCCPTTPSTSRPSASTGTGSTPTCRFLLDRYLPDPDDRTLRRGARRPLRPAGRAAPSPPGPRRPTPTARSLHRYDRWGTRGGRGGPPPDLAREQGRPGAPRLRRPLRPRRAARARRGHRLPGLPGVPGRDGDLLRAGHDRRRGRHRRALRAGVGARRAAGPAHQPRPRDRAGRAGCS